MFRVELCVGGVDVGGWMDAPRTSVGADPVARPGPAVPAPGPGCDSVTPGLDDD